jgi:cytochrome c
MSGLAGLALIPGAPAFAAPSAEELKRGHNLLITYCGSCHATDRTGNSPRPDSPPFRVLGQRYPIESLEESLGEGMMSGHPDMPEISFEADDVGAIVDYLKSIQVR